MKNLYVGNLPTAHPKPSCETSSRPMARWKKSLSSPTGIRAALEVSDSSK